MNPTLRAIEASWTMLNASVFRRALQRPTFALLPGPLGRWDRATRTLALDPEFATTAPWAEVDEVIRHEMAHQYVSDVLGVTDETAHGPAFRRVCREFGVDPTAAGRPEAMEREEPVAVRRIRKLLALATSPVPGEAEAALAAAHRLMAKHHLTEVPDANSDAPDFRARRVGPLARRHPRWRGLLLGALRDAFGVKVILVHTWLPDRSAEGAQYEVMGLEEDVAVVQWTYDFIVAAADRSVDAAGLRGRSDRADYLTGFVSGVARSLQKSVRAAVSEGLVPFAAPGLQAWFDARYPRQHAKTFAVQAPTRARALGEAAGARLDVRRAITEREGPKRIGANP